MTEGPIRFENPFVTPPELREPARRFRGRLAAPVTLWTSGPPDGRAGLTVSSVLVAEGDPPCLLGLIGELGELWEAIRETDRFVVHVLEKADRRLADRFAGVLPSPGGLFAGLEVEESGWGPVLAGPRNRAYCRLEGAAPAGNRLLVRGVIERVELRDLEGPLVWFRGRYVSLPEPPD